MGSSWVSIGMHFKLPSFLKLKSKDAQRTQGFLSWNPVLRFFHWLLFEALVHIQKLVNWHNLFDKKCCIGSKVSIKVEKNWVLLSNLLAKWPQKGVFISSYAVQCSKSYWYRRVQCDEWNDLKAENRAEMRRNATYWRFYFAIATFRKFRMQPLTSAK